jgi:hypothetical protein
MAPRIRKPVYKKKSPDLPMSPDELISRYHSETLYSISLGGRQVILPQSVCFNNTRRRLPVDRFIVEADKQHPKFSIRKKIETRTGKLLRHYSESCAHPFCDSETLRLNNIRESDGRLYLTVSTSRYSYYLGTNYLVDVRLPGELTSLRDEIHPGSSLCPLDQSLLANHIGINALVFTQDGFLIVPRRSAHVNLRSDEYSPSISGAVDYSDFEQKDCHPLLHAVKREGQEELSVTDEKISERNISLLGITRELQRGGKPEIFFMIRLHEPVASSGPFQGEEIGRRENRFIEFADFRNSFRPVQPPPGDQALCPVQCEDDIIRFLAAREGDVSLPLMTNLMLWFEFTSGCPSAL